MSSLKVSKDVITIENSIAPIEKLFEVQVLLTENRGPHVLIYGCDDPWRITGRVLSSCLVKGPGKLELASIDIHEPEFCLKHHLILDVFAKNGLNWGFQIPLYEDEDSRKRGMQKGVINCFYEPEKPQELSEDYYALFQIAQAVPLEVRDKYKSSAVVAYPLTPECNGRVYKVATFYFYVAKV